MEYAIIFLPFIGSIIGYLGKSISKFFSEIFTSLFVTVFCNFIYNSFLKEYKNDHYVNYKIFEWVSSGKFACKLVD